MLNLDTHILLFALEGTLRPRERAALADDRWGISAIVLWEIAKLKQKGRIAVGLDHPPLARVLDRITIWPLDAAVCGRIAELDFKSNPADEIIAATSLEYGAPLVTRDRKIRRSKMLDWVR